MTKQVTLERREASAREFSSMMLLGTVGCMVLWHKCRFGNVELSSVAQLMVTWLVPICSCKIGLFVSWVRRKHLSPMCMHAGVCVTQNSDK